MSFFSVELPAVPVVLVAFAVGGLVCFFGYRLLKVVLGLVGFLAGAVAAGGLASLLAPGSSTAVLVAAGLGGLAGAAVLVWAFNIGTFLVGAAGGLLLGGLGGAWLDGAAEVVAILALAAICGVLALRLQRVVVGISTAILGAAGMVAAGLVTLTGAEETQALAERVLEGGAPGQAGWIGALAWVLLSISGVGVQLGPKEGGKKKKKR